MFGNSFKIEIFSKLQTTTTKKRIITFSTKLLSRIKKKWIFNFKKCKIEFFEKI